MPFHADDSSVLAGIRLPLGDEWNELDSCLIAAAKAFIDYLNESDLAKRANDEIDRMRSKEPDRDVRGIDKFEAFLASHGADSDAREVVSHLRLLQRLRSLSAAHRKSSDLDKLLDKCGLKGALPRIVCRELVLEPLLALCQLLASFAEAHAGQELAKGSDL